MNLKERAVVFVTFLISCLGIALLCGSLGTDYWVVSRAVRESNNRSEGLVNFGLVKGTKRLNHGFGERVHEMDLTDILYRERSFMIKELYIATLGCVSGSLFFAIISAFLSVVNTATDPSEPVCHLPGLIAWNAIAALGSTAAFVTWIIQFFVKLRYNVLTREDVTRFGWNTRGLSSIGHSFWLVVIATGLFVLNIAIVILLEQRRRRRLRQIILAGLDPGEAAHASGNGLSLGSSAASGTFSVSKKQQHFINDSKPNGNLMLY